MKRTKVAVYKPHPIEQFIRYILAVALVFLIVWGLGFVLTGCSSAPKVEQPAAPIVEQKPDQSLPAVPYMKPVWVEKIFTLLEDGQFAKLNMAAKDFERFCPKYASLDRHGKMTAWSYFVGAVISFESGRKDGAPYYKEATSMVEENSAVSQGLLQLTYGDSFCPKKKANGDLNDGVVNLDCGVKIMGSLIGKAGIVTAGGYPKAGWPSATGAGAYWSVLREADKFAWTDSNGKKRFSKHNLKEIMALTARSPGCL
jgi:hypothetical protein